MKLTCEHIHVFDQNCRQYTVVKIDFLANQAGMAMKVLV